MTSNQATSRDEVRFVRIRGRVVPIRAKGGAKKPALQKASNRQPNIVVNVKPKIEVEGGGGSSGGGRGFSMTAGLISGGATYATMKSYIKGNAKVPDALKNIVPEDWAKKGIGGRDRQFHRIIDRLEKTKKPAAPDATKFSLFEQDALKAQQEIYEKRKKMFHVHQGRLKRLKPLAKQNKAFLKSLKRFAPAAAIGVGLSTALGSGIFSGGGGGD